MNDWLFNIRTCIFAPSCVLCHTPVSLALDLCKNCHADLPRQQHACSLCALTLAADSRVGLCGTCLHQPHFDGAIAAFEYTAPVDWLITRLKFHNRPCHARLLGTLLAERVTTSAITTPDCILPMPLHPARYRQRGYNQAALIAHHTARELGLKVKPRLACRTRHTAPQMSLPAGERRHNVRDAFSASADCAGRHIAIIDDVATTGHTAAALAAVLKQEGATSIQLWCVARA